ncbi:TetR family transcriptional regulator [Enterococcus sp. JM4C]|nr:TetR family transcriptional regulator [Enterococcus sp. JM4C]
MPSQTFLQLKSPKKEKIEKILLDVFCKQPVSLVKVSEIVEAMAMSRGAFYKYFTDLEDAYHYIVKKYSGVVHGDILQAISQNEHDFFQGIKHYLAWCGQLDQTSEEWKILKLLTQSNELSGGKRVKLSADSPMLTQWTTLLKNNQFQMSTTEEALSFLYFVMALVMDSIKDLIVNDWSADELVQDFHYKASWLSNGLHTK